MRIITEYDLNKKASKLRSKVFVNEQGFSKEDEYDSNEKEYIHISIYKGPLIVAYVRLHVEGKNGHVGRVVVRKSFRKHGYGKLIMNLAEEEAKENNINFLYLHAQLHAVSFYQKCGYEIHGEQFLEAGAPHYEMVKNL